METVNKNTNSEDDSQTYSEAFPPLVRPLSFQSISATSPPTTNSSRTIKPIPASTVTRVFDIPVEERRRVSQDSSFEFVNNTPYFGKVHRIMEKTGCTIEMSETKNRSLTFMVTGRPTSINEARGMLRSTFCRQFTNEIEIPKWVHKIVVGQKGNRHKSIEQSTGAFIHIPAADNPSKSVRISGAKECVEKATKEIKHISDTAQANYRKDGDKRKDHILECVIPRQHRGKIIGAKGVNVQALSHKHSVSIRFPDRTSRSKSEADIEMSADDGDEAILITGKEENCLRAKEALLDLVPSDIAVEVPLRFHGAIIGSRGENVRSMGDQYGVWIHVPNPELEKDCVYVQGPARNCEKAKEALLKRVKELEDRDEDRELRSHRETVQIAPKYHSGVIGRRGATINKIRKKYDVVIDFPDKASATRDEIDIIGYEHQARAAKKEILHIVEELEERIFEVVDIDFRVHARLIGTRGSAISRVMKRFKVTVHFPQDYRSNKVTIIGKEQNVADAKRHLQSLAEDFMEDFREWEADQKFYKQSTLAASNDHSSGRSEFVVRDAPRA